MKFMYVKKIRYSFIVHFVFIVFIIFMLQFNGSSEKIIIDRVVDYNDKVKPVPVLTLHGTMSISVNSRLGSTETLLVSIIRKTHTFFYLKANN